MPEVAEKDNEQAQDSGAPVAPANKGKSSKATMIIILLLELLAIAFAFIVVVQILKPRIPEWAVQHEEEPVEEEAHSEPGVILTVPDLVVNPAGSKGLRYLSASIGIEVADEPSMHEVEARAPAVRDALIGILSAETVEQLSAPEERAYLRKTIKRELEKLLKPIKIHNVYFIDYVLQ